MPPCGLIILAAGASRRLQQPKQALSYQGTTLLQHSIQIALAAAAHPVIVVTGAYIPDLQPAQDRVQTVFNQAWGEGMASSIRMGLSTITGTCPDVHQVILMVCDQPFVSASLLNQLIQTSASSGKGITACAYRDTVGTPVLFTERYFDKLMALQGDEGAKKIVQQCMDDTAVVPFPDGGTDIDTMEDYETFMQHPSS